MQFDVEGHLRAAERSVSSLEREGQPARAVTLSRSFATTVDDLWGAVTNGERIPRWFSPVSGDLQLGRPLPVGRQRGRHDHGVRTTLALRAHLGVRRRQLGGGACRGRRRRQRAAHALAYRAPVRPLGPVRTGRSRRRLGDGPCWDSRSTSRSRTPRSPTKPPSLLHRTARRSSPAAARDGSRPRSPPARIPRPRMRRRRGQPPSTPANRPPRSLRRRTA